MHYWASVNEAVPLETRSLSPRAKLLAFSNEETGSKLRLIQIERFGHHWPTTESGSVSATAEIWKFLCELSMSC